MIESLSDFFSSSVEFINKFSAWVKEKSPTAIADHICYKCGDSIEFEYLRALFEKESVFIYQSIISSRRIAIIKFSKPLETTLGQIWFLELSDQKPDNSQTSGFDHIEIYPSKGSVESLVAELELQGVGFEKVVRPHHTTFDARVYGEFKVRLEPEALIDKIKKDEMIR